MDLSLGIFGVMKEDERHKQLLFYSVLKWLFSRRVMDTLARLREDVRALPVKDHRDLFDLLCDKQ